MPYRILILNYEYPPLGGGAGVITKHLANEFSDAGHEVTILTTWFRELERDEKRGNLRIIRIDSRRVRLDRSNIREMYSYMKKAWQYARDNFREGQFDICLANFTLPGGFVANKLRKRIGLPFMIISHGHDIPWFYPKQMFMLHMAFYPVIKKICTDSERNIVLTSEMKGIADDFMGKELCSKNVIIPNGIHQTKFIYGEKPHDKLKILFVGRLVEQKDPLLFMQVMKLLKEQGVDFEARVLGGGALRKKLEQFRESNELYEVIVHGKVAHREVIDWMMESHVLLAPSTHEAMSVTILEALSCGLYIVTTPISGNTEIVTYNGVLVDSREPAPYADEIRAFHEDVFIQGHFERKPVPEELLQEYNWKVVAERYIEVIEEVLREKEQP